MSLLESLGGGSYSRECAAGGADGPSTVQRAHTGPAMVRFQMSTSFIVGDGG
jgi:hypothetical protein